MTVASMLENKRILVVEDEYFIASDLTRELTKAGVTVVGPAGDVETALALLADNKVDAAILDVNLESTSSFPIADRLRECSTPFVFLTGYDGWALPEAYRQAPRLAKPFSMHAVLACVLHLISAEVDAR